MLSKYDMLTHLFQKSLNPEAWCFLFAMFGLYAFHPWISVIIHHSVPLERWNFFFGQWANFHPYQFNFYVMGLCLSLFEIINHLKQKMSKGIRWRNRRRRARRRHQEIFWRKKSIKKYKKSARGPRYCYTICDDLSW